MHDERNEKRLQSPPRSRFTVLIVDDDPAQLQTLYRGLFLNGFRCLCISKIDDAIDFLNKPDREEVHLLITDITARTQRVLEMIRHAHALYPNMPIVAISGLVSPGDVRTAEEAVIAVLKRPFSPHALCTTVWETLGHHGTSHFHLDQ